MQQGAAMQLSALSWFSSAAVGSGGRRVFPAGDDPFCLSEPGQDESEDQSQEDNIDVLKCLRNLFSDLKSDWTVAVGGSTVAQGVLFFLRDGGLVASTPHLQRTRTAHVKRCSAMLGRTQHWLTHMSL